MERTAIVTDTNSGISPAQGEELGVFVIPMPVIVDGQDFLEHVSITQEMLYQAILEGKDVCTSQPSPENLTGCWKKVLESGYDSLVYIPMSSGLSNSCATAQAFAAEFDGRVQVADSHRIAVTLRDSVLEAKSLADSGMGAEDIRVHLEKTGWESSIYIAVKTLDLLKKSGRVTPAAAAVATMLHIMPILTIQGEKLDAFAKARGSRNCEKRIIEAVRKDIETRFGDREPATIHIGAAGTFAKKEDADEWLNAVRTAFPENDCYYNQLSCSIACHVSVDAIGIGICSY